MKRIKAKLSISYFLVGMFVCVFLIGSTIKSNVKPSMDSDHFTPSVQSLASKLEVVQTKMLGPNVFQVIVKNGYSKDITAVVAFLGDEKVTRTDYIYAELERDQKLSPGATDEFLYTIDSKDEENIVIKSVLFSDMTVDGDRKSVQRVLDKRQAMKIQFTRFNSQLKKLNKVAPSHLEAEFQKVRQIAEDLPVTTEDGSPMSQAFEHGLRHGKEFILRYLNEMGHQLQSEKVLALSDNKQSQVNKYEKFKKKSLRVENDFKSLESRLGNQ
jgi:hypothetical protein